MEALTAFPSVEATRVVRADQVLEVRHRLPAASGAKVGAVTLLHVAAYTPNDPASLVPIQAGVADADLSETPPPPGSEFLDGDLMALIFGNDVCICTSGLTEASLNYYLYRLFDKMGLPFVEAMFEIQKVANRKALEDLVSHGVREISFDFVTYESSISASKARGGSVIAEALASLFARDASVEDLLHQSGVQGLLTLKADGRVAHGAAQYALSDLARRVVSEDADGFVIETKAGDKITPSELSIKRSVALEKDAKTIKYTEAWNELISFYDFVNENGLNQF